MSAAIRFLYGTAIGRLLLKPLVCPAFSKRMAFLFSSRLSARFVPTFIRKNGIHMETYEVPEGGYGSFNDFFTRKRKAEFTVPERKGLICPCDALLTVSPITEDVRFSIKNTTYSAASLLRDGKLASRYLGGTALIFRLTPAHYHRYAYCADGVTSRTRRIPGILHSVQPICHEKTDVFVENSREYVVIKNPKVGPIVQMEVGALLVGKISNHDLSGGQQVLAGREKGYFEYGGSSIVVLLPPGIAVSGEITGRAKVDNEIPVQIGENVIQ